jgi:hypothetical protein
MPRRRGATVQPSRIAASPWAAARCLAASLAALQRFLDIAHRPVLAGRDDPDTTVVGHADERMRGDIVDDAHDVEVGVRLPVERHREIAGKDTPLRPVVEFDDMAFRVRSDLQRLPRS